MAANNNQYDGKFNINIWWDAGTAGAILCDLKLNKLFRSQASNFGKVYKLEYDDLFNLTNARHVRLKTALLTIYTFKNVGINRITSATLNRQIGHLVFYLSKSIDAHRLAIVDYDEQKCYHRVVNDAQPQDDRAMKKVKTMAMFNVRNEHVGDALMLHGYSVLKKLKLL